MQCRLKRFFCLNICRLICRPQEFSNRGMSRIVSINPLSKNLNFSLSFEMEILKIKLQISLEFVNFINQNQSFMIQFWRQPNDESWGV